MKTFVNLPVKDLAIAIDFFTTLGFSFDPNATGEMSACMIVSDEAYVMLHVESYFEEYTGSEIADTSKYREATLGLAVDNRVEVDDLIERVVAAGGMALGGPEEQGFIYMRAFLDPDGHQWSFLHMDLSAP